MTDPRLTKLAKILVGYSCKLQKGEKILIEARGIDPAFVREIIKEVYAAGGFPFVETIDATITRELLKGTGEEHCKLLAKYATCRMQEMDAYIGIRGGENSFELSDISAENNQIYQRLYSQPVHNEIRVKKTKWVVLRYPNPSMAQLAGMSTEQFEQFYFDVCTLDYSKMDRAMDALKELMEKTDRVRITAKDTDLQFSIKGIAAVKCSGESNIPDGEVYTAPVKDSVNGYISYNTPTVNSGVKHEGVRLEFKDGKIVNAQSSNTQDLNKVLDTDEGARYVGEFAIGVNPYITKPILDILFDEKISGSIHFTPGASYDEASNGNSSSVHWDMVLIQTPDYGGGEIYFDDCLIRKDGRFTLPELYPLNHENLK